MLVRIGLLSVPHQDEIAVAHISQLLREHLASTVLDRTMTADSQRNWIEEILRQWCDEEELDLILTIGGTTPAPGPSNAEIIPLATHAVVERPLPGLTQAMRAHAAQQSALAWLDCGVAGIRGRSLLINLPEGATAALLFLEAVVELLEPILLHLHGAETAPCLADELEIVGDQIVKDEAPAPSDSTASSSVPSGKSSGLNAEEFSAFLRRRRNSTS